ncbi:hypothetical protein GCM10020258_57380 [Sphingomonas yabuuchiae]
MCTNYRRTKGFDQVCEEFYETRIPVRFPERHQAPNLEPQPEVRPTNRAVVLRAQEDGVALTWMRWGLIPFFHKGPVSGWKAATFNARAEGVKTAPSFRDAFKRRRCLIAAEGWVEWKGRASRNPNSTSLRGTAHRSASPACGIGRGRRTRARSRASRW